ncbi:MAG: hypothetical protein J7K15_10240 [Deltaproteobacteria bacterium]|nr:hypothetical protein [Deltaproteobacteria bacterium]
MVANGYTTIKVSKKTHAQLETLKKELGMSFDQVVQFLIQFYMEHKNAKPQVDAKELDRAAWYMLKLAFSVQVLKQLVDEGRQNGEVERQLQRLKEICGQIEERLKVDADIVIDAAYEFLSYRDVESKTFLNSAVKEVYKRILARFLGFEVKY